MNFKDYLNSDGLNPSYNVMVTPEDCEYFQPVKYDSRFTYELGLLIDNVVYHYVIKKGFGNRIFVLDSDGNPKGRSCFILVESEEKKLVENYVNKQDANSVMKQLYEVALNKVNFPKFTTQFNKQFV